MFTSVASVGGSLLFIYIRWVECYFNFIVRNIFGDKKIIEQILLLSCWVL